MFNSNKKLIFVDYQDSYFYQQKRKKQRRKWFKFILLLVLVTALTAVIVPLARANNLDNELGKQAAFSAKNGLIHGPQLIFLHPENTKKVALPIDITANIEINGLVAYTQIKQVFINPYDIELEGKYQFPLPEKSAIKHLTVKVADKEIIGQIMEKETAKKVFKRAKKQGKKASLVQQQRPNLFTNNIANIPPKSTVVVTLEFIMPVTFSQNSFNLKLPLAITARYQSDNDQKSPAEKNSEFMPPMAKMLANSEASINIALNAGASIASIKSHSHKIKTKTLTNEQSSYLITLSHDQMQANRDFDLNWQLQASEKPQVSSFSEQVGSEYFTLLTFFPPSVEQTTTLARDIIFIIDTSGSMQGNSMIQAKASLQEAILKLSTKDSFNIIAFDDSVALLFPETNMASERNISQAQQFIKSLQADGGTEMYRPLSQALVMAKDHQQTAKAIRQVVFITDGAVANEFELMQLLDGAQRNFRLFTVGIGAAPNGYFMKKAAQFGRGSYVFIQNNADVQSQMSALMTKINHPAITNIELMFDNQVHQEVDVYPKKIADLYFGEPMQVTVKSKLPITSVQVMGDTAESPWYQQLIIDDSQSSRGISTLWARRKIEDLLDSLVTGANKEQVKAQVISTSITHQTLSPYTSFIAVEKRPELIPLTAQNSTSGAKRKISTLAKAHENLMVAMPKTALGWHQQLLIGLFLMLLAPLLLRIWSK
ncbi:marine proteobacterial sortase target protein [Cognaticolwellia beringensis]|uniref:Marine proteobacterial sortase target protein n=1 Tax=Cognaticolwellia beringensis TaxID=1967665 RepID=A0A222GBF5_9GAMM|nr:marine proteobacterial sortase target protein [Cognaticolwellia beringensis]ASP48684.1 marine proteobacterial sortase target protein [Cognaticolwellia beringensis]